MKLYVYRLSDQEYGAGLGLEGCQKRGDIVECWPLDTPAQAKFLARHGTSYGRASEQVSRIADHVHGLMALDPTWVPPADQSAPKSETTSRPKLLERIRAWFFAR